MFKNKFVIGFLILALAFIFYYSFMIKESYIDTIKKEFEAYKTTMANMDDSPVKSGEEIHIEFFEPNENLKFEADFKSVVNSDKFEMDMTDSSKSPAKIAGYIVFDYEGRKNKMLVFVEEQNYVLPFTDKTNGKETYGGGRYINIPKNALLDNKLTVDFNMARNYYCVYNEKFICPIPPKENKLDLNITVGEKTFLDHD